MTNFNHLYYFYVVAKLKNVTAAARVLKTSQPSLSNQIKTLENNLNRSLFVKKGKYLELTDEGHRVYNFCVRMFQVYDEFENYLQGKNFGNEIRFGFSSEISRPFVSNIVSEVMKKYKLNNRPLVKMSCSSHEVLVEKLRTNKLDYILTNVNETEFDLITLKEINMPIVLVGSDQLIGEIGMKGVKRPETILKKVSGRLALPSENLKLRTETNLFMTYKKLQYKAAFESDVLYSLIQSTMEGIAFGLFPRPYIINELREKSLKILMPQKSLWFHHLYLIGNKNNNSKAHFIKKLSSEIESLL